MDNTKGGQMKIFKAVVIERHVYDVTVEAEDLQSAKSIVYTQLPSKPIHSDMDIYEIEEVKHE